MVKNKFLMSGMILLLGVLMISFVFAMGVSTPYMPEVEIDGKMIRQLNLYPGDTADFTFKVANEQETYVVASIVEGSEVIILKNPSEKYFLEEGNKWTSIDFLINVPESANIGDKYKVVVSFTTVTDGESGSFNFGSAIDKSFEVVVGERPKVETPAPVEEGDQSSFLIILLIVVLILILVYFIRKNKKVFKKKKK